MANINGAYGLRPAKNKTGTTTATTEYKIADAYVTPIYMGDPVVINAGYIEIGTDDGVTHQGIFAGCQYTNAQGEAKFSKFWTGEAGATEKKALVFDDPATIFMVQASTASQANVGGAYDLDVTAGIPTIGLSKTFLNTDGTTGAAYKIIEIVDGNGNDGGLYADVLVVAVKHALA